MTSGDKNLSPAARGAGAGAPAGTGLVPVNDDGRDAGPHRLTLALGLRLRLPGLMLLAVSPAIGAVVSAAEAPLKWFVAGTTLVLAAALAWAAAEVSILRRVRQLASVARRLAGGDYQARTGVGHNHDEIGQAAAALDLAAAVLDHRSREAHLARRRMARLNRMYRVLAGVNGAIQTIRDRDDLLREVCRVAATKGEFRLAWIGMVEEDGNAARAVAWAVGKDVRPDAVSASIETAPGNWALVHEATRRDRRTVCNDCLRDRRTAAERTLAQAAEFRSIAAFPLRIEGRAVGALALCAAESGFFDSEEIRLLDEFAADVSLGLEHIAKDRKLRYLAYHDPATALPNVTLFADRLRQALARARHHQRIEAVMVLEIADFRQTTSEMGRDVADRLVREIARYVRGCLREGDTVARLNGDEIGVILTDMARVEDAARVVGNMKRDFPDSITVERQEIFVRFRIGVAIYPGDGDEPETLVRNAYMALRAPDAEIAAVRYYDPRIDAAIRERRRIEQALHHAIERQELYLHYQPVVDIASGEIVGVEALARWTSADLGPVPPGRFIPVAEETGLIVALGEWVFMSACRQAVRWREAGLDGLRIAVNVSTRQLKEPDFMDRVGAMLEATGVHAAQLVVEITESSLMADLDAGIALCKRLRERGFTVCIDDFGTGYSSLRYLNRLPVDVLKIDQGFVQEMETNRGSRSIVKAIISLAHGLGYCTIAEGVETETQLAILRESGSDAAQGFLLGRPQSAEALWETLGKGRGARAARRECGAEAPSGDARD